MNKLVAAAVTVTLLCFAQAAAGSAPEAETPAASRAPLRPALGYWSQGEPRPFVSMRSELGAPYVKPYLSFGYGMPHWLWTGADLNAIVTPDFAQGYAGVRAASPVLDLAFGARDTKSFDKPFLTPRPVFTRSLVLDAPGESAHYLALEAEAVAIVPLPHAALVFDFIAVHTLDVPDDRYVYDESYRVITRDALFFVLRTAAVARFGNEQAFKAGAVAEHVFGTGRGQGVWRLGPALLVQLTDHLEFVSALTLAVSSPDELGLVLGAYGVAGLRYRWATGEPRPEAPWSGEFIPW